MSFMEMTKKILFDFFIIVTGITIILAVFGDLADPGRTFGYEVFYSPLLFGLIGVAPSFVFYSKKELPFGRMVIRKILHFALLELMVVGTYIILGASLTFDNIVALMIFIFIVYLFTTFIRFLIDRKTMVEINTGLKKMQNQ